MKSLQWKSNCVQVFHSFQFYVTIECRGWCVRLNEKRHLMKGWRKTYLARFRVGAYAYAFKHFATHTTKTTTTAKNNLSSFVVRQFVLDCILSCYGLWQLFCGDIKGLWCGCQLANSIFSIRLLFKAKKNHLWIIITKREFLSIVK